MGGCTVESVGGDVRTDRSIQHCCFSDDCDSLTVAYFDDVGGICMVHDGFPNFDEMGTHLSLNDLLPACHWILYAELCKEEVQTINKVWMVDVITWTCVI